MKKFKYGWVPLNVVANHMAHCSNSQIGTEDEMNLFYENTLVEYGDHFQFCYEEL